MVRMPKRAVLVVSALLGGPVLAAELPPVAREISTIEMAKTLDAINYDRTSGRAGEKRAAGVLEEKLRAYGVGSVRHEMSAYLSWPGKAAVEAMGPESFPLRAITHAFAAPTPPEGITAEVVFLPRTREDDQTPIEPDVHGRIVVAEGLVSPESAWRAQRAGAAGLVHVNDTDVLHEMITTTIWGTPTSESAARIPRLPVVSIGKADGERLRAAARKPGFKLRIAAEVTQGWTTIPLVVAEVKGRTADFLLVATHLDAWYEGMTDTAGTVASILEMARVLQKHRALLERGVRFAWWPGHSFGRYAGSTWYADRFWADLDRHCVAYTNLDGAGRRGSRLDALSAGSWPGIAEWSREFAKDLTGREPLAEGDGKALFRPGRDSDSAFQGLGIPEFSIGVPGPPEGHADVEPGGLIRYWHTANDTLDKLDMKALELDTRYRTAQLAALATRPTLPHRIRPIADAYGRAIDDLVRAAGSALDLSSTRKAAADLGAVAARLDVMPVPSAAAARASRDRLLVRLTHRLNSRLYSRAGRFDQDPAAAVPILPLLARARELPAHPPDSDAFGFLETELVRGRNAVEATLQEATEEIEHFLSGGSGP
jgi:Zn-dependent M28 family amino/carboxypeptidase